MIKNYGEKRNSAIFCAVFIVVSLCVCDSSYTDRSVTNAFLDESGGRFNFTDRRDGATYRAVRIGGTVWMAENLNYDDSSGRSSCIDNQASNCVKFGRLYQWGSAINACPEGWRLPTKDEWHYLIDSVPDVAMLMSKNGWDDYSGTDNFGFSALPGFKLSWYDWIAWWWAASMNMCLLTGSEMYTECCGENSSWYQYSVRCVQERGGK
jgi:uncharacterized protein (TIGR02145 family)